MPTMVIYTEVQIILKIKSEFYISKFGGFFLLFSELNWLKTLQRKEATGGSQYILSEKRH